MSVRIQGGGPAGAAAALAAKALGAEVRVAERGRFPRHKVCGEFFSPEIESELSSLGVWPAFVSARPARITRTALVFGTRRKEARLAETAWGLSRFAFDALMLRSAEAAGAIVAGNETAGVGVEAQIFGQANGEANIVACGRRVDQTRRGNRQFGFKAHFEGPATDTVELYFFDGCYVGVSGIENGRTNVCGLGAERVLGACGWDFDALVRRSPALAERLAPMRRAMDWLSTGPLVYGQRFEGNGSQAIYRAGDALSFVDPFTGSGLLAAVRSGRLAGEAAARGDSVDAYLQRCRASLRTPFLVAGALRWLSRRAGVEKLAGVAPAGLLFALTRPR